MQMRTLISTLALGALALTLSGCGGGDSATTTTAAPAAGGTTTKKEDGTTTKTQVMTTTTNAGPTTTTTTTTMVPDPFCAKESVSSDFFASDRKLSGLAKGDPIGWNPTGAVVAKSAGKFCEVKEPAKTWDLNQYCGPVDENASPAHIKVLSYNLYWWNLFKQRKGNNNEAVKNIAANSVDMDFDIMGFQECEDIDLVINTLNEVGVKAQYSKLVGTHATAIAYKTDSFEATILGQGIVDVAEDNPGKESYGKRMVHWVRLTHKASQKPVFFMNHHGPMTPNTGGICGGQGTAYNILKVIAANAKVGDSMILVGDFNAPWMMGEGDGSNGVRRWQEEAGYLNCHLPHAFGSAEVIAGWGIDGVYSSCTRLVKGVVMPKGGSDHVALSVVFDLNGAEPSVIEEPVTAATTTAAAAEPSAATTTAAGDPAEKPSGDDCATVIPDHHCNTAVHEGACYESGKEPQCVESGKFSDYVCPDGWKKCGFTSGVTDIFAV